MARTSGTPVARRGGRWVALVMVVFCGPAALAQLPPAHPAAAAETVAAETFDPFGSKTTTLFTSQDPGCYRIPAIVRTREGSLLAFAEYRVDSCADKSNTRIVMRRLPAGATTWEDETLVLQGTPSDPAAPATRGNAAPVLYRTVPGASAGNVPDGRIVLPSTYNWVDPANPGGSHDQQPRTPYVQYSDDDGRGWSPAQSLYSQIDDPSWDHYATGPMHAIQLQRGPHPGRLVVGVNYSRTDLTGARLYGALIAYSDDGGDTWHKGARTEYPTVSAIGPQELSLVELANGEIYVWARQQWSSGVPEEEADVYVRPHRLFAVSKDAGQSFTGDGFQLVPGFEAPRVESAALRLRATDEGDQYNRILTSAPSVNDSRSRMTIRSSFDEGRTWQGVDTPSDSTDEGLQVWGTPDRTVSKAVCACYAGYSDLVELATGEVGLLYERGASSSTDEIAFVRLNDSDLHTPATTPDTAGGVSGIVFDGAAPTTAGRFGSAIGLDGQNGRIQLPYKITPVLGPGDFTLSVWFKYGASTASQAIFWAYGLHSEPQVWIRAEPGADRIRALLTPAGRSSVSVSSTGAFNDNAWHHVALRRTGDTLAMFIDGTQVAATTGASGAVTGGDPTPIYLGQRIDGAHRLSGSIDELRVYNRALTTDELTRLRTANATNIPGLTARLPMDVLNPATPDASGYGHHAAVHGGAAPHPGGRFGLALTLDGEHDDVQLPNSPKLALGSSDFTVSVWIKYGASSASQAIFWAYGLYSQPQVWIRAEPSHNRIRALLTPAGGGPGASVSSTGAYNDNAWHHVVLRRAGDTLSMFIDGTQVAATTGAGGTANGPAPHVIYLGRRLDGIHRFNGSLDEVRVYDRPLSAADIINLVHSNQAGGAGPLIWLPLDTLIN